MCYIFFQNPKTENFENWFDANEVVLKKRGKIAQIIRQTFPEKEFAFPKTASVAIHNPQESAKSNILIQQSMQVSFKQL
jgi:hypothetical protein